MNCPNCGTLNADTSRFCMQCGNQLPQVPQRPTGSAGLFEMPQDPIGQAATIGGIAGIAGGGITILGWLLPWFNLGRLLGGLLDFLNLFGGFGINFGSGVGNGLQLTFFSLVGGFAALTDGDTFLIGILALLLAGALVAIPVLGGLNIRTGIKIFEERSSYGNAGYSPLPDHFQKIRRRSTASLVIMVILFVFISMIPFATSVLASGFYLTALGAIGTFIAVLYSRSRIRS